MITNTVCCRPVDILYLDQDYENNPPDTLDDLVQDEDYQLLNFNREPTKAEAELCRPHIDELIDTYKPHGVVYLGKIALQYKCRLPKAKLLHPAAIARMEYKLVPVKQEARKIDELLHKIHQKEGIA